MTLNYVIGNEDELGIKALREALIVKNISAIVEAADKVQSGVNEQPKGISEIFEGVRNRIYAAEEQVAEGDVYFSVESGLIFTYENEWVDIAMCAVYIPKIKFMKTELSDPVVFPTHAVEMTLVKEGGFEFNTVGQTLKEIGLVTSDKDPHIDLPPYKSRNAFIQETFEKLLDQLPAEYQ
jgi:non-canonical (house-cleaning) NTP pyrophosphatase